MEKNYSPKKLLVKKHEKTNRNLKNEEQWTLHWYNNCYSNCILSVIDLLEVAEVSINLLKYFVENPLLTIVLLYNSLTEKKTMQSKDYPIEIK